MRFGAIWLQGLKKIQPLESKSRAAELADPHHPAQLHRLHGEVAEASRYHRNKVHHRRSSQHLCKGLCGPKKMAALGNSDLTSVLRSCWVWRGVGAGDRKQIQQIPENSDFWVCWFVSYVNSRVYIRVNPSQLSFSSPKESHSQNSVARRTSIPEKEEGCQTNKSICRKGMLLM